VPAVNGEGGGLLAVGVHGYGGASVQHQQQQTGTSAS
jgi:hypothetical protein